MKTISEINDGIQEIIDKIKTTFPELLYGLPETHLKNRHELIQRIYLGELQLYTNSLIDLMNKYAFSFSNEIIRKNDDETNPPGYPSYPEDEDIYNKLKAEPEINPENPSKKKSRGKETQQEEEILKKNDNPGEDLDVPGSELDDQQEDIGSEDEENNYYSLSNDNE